MYEQGEECSTMEKTEYAFRATLDLESVNFCKDADGAATIMVDTENGTHFALHSDEVAKRIGKPADDVLRSLPDAPDCSVTNPGYLGEVQAAIRCTPEEAEKIKSTIEGWQSWNGRQMWRVCMRETEPAYA